MYLSLLLFSELIILFLLSRRLNQSIYSLFLLLTKSQHTAIAATTLLLFPGTVVHELSHLFTAEILGVRTGKLSLFPERINAEHIQAGSVQVAVTDPFRRTLIGLSPIFIGIITITLLSIYEASLLPHVLAATREANILKNPILYLFVGIGYLLFAISNNMFSSKEDMQGVVPVLLLLGVILVAIYAIGFRLQITGNILTTLESVLKTLTTNLGIVLGINVVLLIVFSFFLVLAGKKR